MRIDTLRRHPAYQGLTAAEQARIDDRLRDAQLDALSVAAQTGDVSDLEPDDLRAWLAISAQRPFAALTPGDLLALHGDRFRRFQAVREAQDPRGKFLNPFTQRVFVG